MWQRPETLRQVSCPVHGLYESKGRPFLQPEAAFVVIWLNETRKIMDLGDELSLLNRRQMLKSLAVALGVAIYGRAWLRERTSRALPRTIASDAALDESGIVLAAEG